MISWLRYRWDALCAAHRLACRPGPSEETLQKLANLSRLISGGHDSEARVTSYMGQPWPPARKARRRWGWLERLWKR